MKHGNDHVAETKNEHGNCNIELNTLTILVKFPSLIIKAMSNVLSTSIFKPAHT